MERGLNAHAEKGSSPHFKASPVLGIKKSRGSG